MPLSSAPGDVTIDKPTQDEVRREKPRTTISIMLKNATALSPESQQSKESKKEKVESKDVEENKKNEKAPPQTERVSIQCENNPPRNENLTDSKQKEPVTKVAKTEELKNVEVKKEKAKPEVTKLKILTGTTATQTRAPECKMIPIVSTSVSLK